MCQNDQCNESWRTQEDVCKEVVWWYETQGETGVFCIRQDAPPYDVIDVSIYSASALLVMHDVL